MPNASASNNVIERSGPALGVAIVVGILALAATRWKPVARLAAPRRGDRPQTALAARPERALPASLRSACRRIDGASALLALAALTDSGIEHYRGSFHNRTMFVPLGVSALALLAALRDAFTAPAERSEDGNAIDMAALATGIIGTGFHLYNVTKRPSGFSFLNLFYGAPLGAPAALSLAGLLRKAGALVQSDARVAGIEASRLLAELVAVGLIGTSAEATLLHFRGAFHNPAMVIPVTVPPIAAVLLAQAAAKPGQEHPIARRALRLLTAAGLLGSCFHAYGIQRNMGGWRNWTQHILNGPPLPAPPAFTALAIAGLAALDLIERRT